MIKRIQNSTKGFTLVEMLVAIGILAVLAASLIAVMDPFTQIKKGNDGRRKADLNQIQKALEVYYGDYKEYPYSIKSGNFYYLDPITSSSPSIVKTQKAWGASWTPYMNIIPKDTNSNKSYFYYSSDGQSYYLYASLDRGPKDPQSCSGDVCSVPPSSGVTLTGVGSACGSNANCDFGVSSPNVSP